MRNRLAGALALVLTLCTVPVRAQTGYVVKDANGVTQTMGSTIRGGVNYPDHVVVDPASGTPLNITTGGAAKVDASATVQPVSASALPLPAGAATAANQPTLNGDGGALAHVTNFPTSQAVTGTFWQTTQPISGSVSPTGVTTTSTPVTVTTGGTFQSALASNASRKGCLIQNPIAATETLFVFFGPNGSAATNASIGLAPGASISCNAGPNVLTDNVSVEGATTGHAFVVTSQ